MKSLFIWLEPALSFFQNRLFEPRACCLLTKSQNLGPGLRARAFAHPTSSSNSILRQDFDLTGERLIYRCDIERKTRMRDQSMFFFKRNVLARNAISRLG